MSDAYQSENVEKSWADKEALSVRSIAGVIVSTLSIDTSKNPLFKEQPVLFYWQQALDSLKDRITSHNYELWISPIRYLGDQDDQITLQVPNTFIRDWVEEHYWPLILEKIFGFTNKKYRLLWVVREDFSETQEEYAQNLKNEELAQKKIISSPKDVTAFLPNYTFENFVVGPSNQLAEAACRAICEQPASKYNPLFIYGGVGLGKTHLLHAVGQSLQKKHPQWRVVYLKSETFINEYIQAIRTQKIDDFRKKYREYPDVLLVDDIQYLGGKERTQDEFFHTFNTLFENRKQIVMTADKYPHEIQDLEERLCSRFQWGLIADIQVPDLETKLAILMMKADAQKIHLPIEVAQYLAKNIRSNVRELEGCLLRLSTLASLKKMPLTVDFAEDTLKSVISSQQVLSIDFVQQEVARYFRISTADLKGIRRTAQLARARQIAMYLARKLCQASYPELGAQFGGKDHTTVLSACRKIESLLKDQADLRQVIREIERGLLA